MVEQSEKLHLGFDKVTTVYRQYYSLEFLFKRFKIVRFVRALNVVKS